MLRVSIAQVKRNLSVLINKVAYGGERIIVESRGKPKVAIVSVEDLERLKVLEEESPEERRARRMAALEQADRVRAQIRARRGDKPYDEEDSVAVLNRLREERTLELAGLLDRSAGDWE